MSKKYIKELVNKGNILLLKNNLSESERKVIEEDLLFFRQILSNDFENHINEEKQNEHKPFKVLKNEILIFMKKMYKQLGEGLINHLIDLESEQIFYGSQPSGETNLSVDEMLELTLKNYETNSKFLLGVANKILSSKPTNQIQIVNELESSSYCHFSELAKIPFLIVDPSEDPHILNHELEHGIEWSLNINNNDFFSELGSIYFETLFTDVLYKSRGFIYPDSYTGRIEDASYQLQYLTDFFKIMKIFDKNNFNVSNDFFKQILLENIDIENEDIESYLKHENIIYDIEENIIYLLSFLKAIELREKTKNIKEDKINCLMPYINNDRVNSDFKESNFAIYKDYILEMESKTKIKQM